MLKIVKINLLFTLLCWIRLIGANDGIVCQKTAEASRQLESYYHWLYRLKNIHTSSNALCSLSAPERKKLCAVVAKACFPYDDNPGLENTKLQAIEDAMPNPEKCKKHVFKTRLSYNRDTWSRKKSMYICELFTIEDQLIRPFYLSAAGIPNAVLVFNKGTPDPSAIRLVRLVTGLSYEPKTRGATQQGGKDAQKEENDTQQKGEDVQQAEKDAQEKEKDAQPNST